MADFAAAATCLTGTYIVFITQEAAKMAARMASIVASFTDPLENLKNTNVSQMVQDVSDLASGDISGNLASMGAAIIVNRVKRELSDILKEVIQQNPGIGDMIQRITNLSQAVYGIVSLAVMLRKQAPYSAVKYSIDEIKEIIATKESILKSMQQHIIQLNNVIMATTDDPEDMSEKLKEDFRQVSIKLGEAEESLLAMEYSLAATPSVFSEKDYQDALNTINQARAIVAPQTDVNLLDATTALIPGGVDTQFLTDAQKKMSAYSALPLAYTISCELNGVVRCVDRANRYLSQLEGIIPSYEESVESQAMKDFRSRLLSQLRIRVHQLKTDIDSALSQESLDRLSLHAMSWASRMNTIASMAPKVRDQMHLNTDDEKTAQMQAELDDVLDALADIDGPSVSGGIESTVGLRAQVNLIVGQAKNLMSVIGTSKMSQMDLDAFISSVHTVAKGSSSSIDESISVGQKIKSALDKFKTYPDEDQSLGQLIALLDLLGLDRAKDLLKLGNFKEFLNTNLENASYIGIVIKCLISAEEQLLDSVTIAVVSKMRSVLQNQKFAQLSAAFDILDSGKNAAILEITSKLEEGQANIEKVKRVIETLTDLAAKAGETVSQIQSAAEGLGDNLGSIITGPEGVLNEVLANLDIPGLQSGCQGQLKF